MLFGYDQGVMGGFLTSAPFKRTFPEISNGNSTLQGFTVAVYELGCAAGALTVIIGGDKFGRRVTVMLGELIIILGAVLQASSFQLGQLIGGRVVSKLYACCYSLTSREVTNGYIPAGFGNGMAAAVLPTWNGECAQPKSRGRAIMWQLTVNIVSTRGRLLERPLSSHSLSTVRDSTRLLGWIRRQYVFGNWKHGLVLAISSSSSDRVRCSHYSHGTLSTRWAEALNSLEVDSAD